MLNHVGAEQGIGEAINFHEGVGAKRKEERLKAQQEGREPEEPTEG